jgi:putative ABC transport system permease protein
MGVRGAIVATSASRHPERTAFTAAVLAIGTLLYVFLTALHGSIRNSFVEEVNQQVFADLLVSSAFLSDGALTSPVDATVAATLASMPLAREVMVERRVHETYRGARILLAVYGARYFTGATDGHRRFVAGDPPAALAAVASGTAVLVSDNFAFHFGTRLGDLLELATPTGTVRLPVAGIVVDNFDSTGTVLLAHDTYRHWWRDDLANWVHVVLTPGTTTAAAKAAIQASLRDRFRLRIIDGAELRTQVGTTVDGAFQFTTPLRAVVLLVVLLGLADTLLVSVLGRTQEIGVLRAIGAKRGDVSRLVVFEGMLISLLGALMGVAGGVALAAVWMPVHFKYLFGWTIGLDLPVLPLVTVVGLMLLVAGLAAMYPARRAGRLPVTRSLAYE